MKTNTFFKIITFIVLVILISPSAFGQNSASRMDREKAKQQNMQAESGMEYQYVYSVVEVMNRDGELVVKMQGSKIKPVNEQEKQTMMVQEKRKQQLEAQMEPFKSEADILNYFSRTGMELVTVAPNLAKDGKSKMYYLRSKIER